ncbi:cell division topological specificity factor MinE [Buchnera aphidicola (Takecallis taiwana)]|uniref:cell division topological specificity factor MinE n=1 Tax=Buchnera aphidicola TaxID=9 RepID=UPI0031B6B3C9
MSLLDFFLSCKKNTAYIAKKRLQIMFFKQKQQVNYSKYFIKLKKEILLTVEKYIHMKPNILTVRANQKDPNIFILELNIRQKK